MAILYHTNSTSTSKCRCPFGGKPNTRHVFKEWLEGECIRWIASSTAVPLFRLYNLEKLQVDKKRISLPRGKTLIQVQQQRREQQRLQTAMTITSTTPVKPSSCSPQHVFSQVARCMGRSGPHLEIRHNLPCDYQAWYAYTSHHTSIVTPGHFQISRLELFFFNFLGVLQYAILSL